MDFVRFFTLAAESVPLPQPGTQQQAPGDMMIGTLGMLVAMGMIFYLLIWRPESKRRKDREQVLNAVKTKDKVVTVGGLHGTVVDVEKDEIVLLVDPKKDVKLRFRRSAIDSIEAAPAEEKK